MKASLSVSQLNCLSKDFWQTSCDFYQINAISQHLLVLQNEQKKNINEILFYSNLAVFPNPTKGEIVIDLGFYSNDIVAIIRNAYGQEITIQNFRNTERIMLNIDGEVGLYFIEIITPVGELITKVIKE